VQSIEKVKEIVLVIGNWPFLLW